jgi:hypothetical protein
MHGRGENTYKILVGKREGRRPQEDLNLDDIKMDLREIGWEDVDWIHLTQDTDQWRAL